jgi:TatD DNase family protein
MIDSHAHLTSSLVEDAVAMIERARAQKIETIINICTDFASLEKGLKLQEKYPFIFNAAATTPHDVEKEGLSFFPKVVHAASEKKLIAIGETGLDYHYEHSPKSIQKSFLVRYLHLALATALPVVIHCRDAFSDLFDIADHEYPSPSLLLHCFTGSLEEAKKALDRNWIISFSGIITFKKSDALRDVVQYVPLDRMLVETDTPYLAPQSKRGLPNEPSFLGEIVSLIAQIKRIDVTQVAEVTSKNATSFFSLEKKIL